MAALWVALSRKLGEVHFHRAACEPVFCYPLRVAFSDNLCRLPCKCLTCQNECLVSIHSRNKEEGLKIRKVGILSYRSEKAQTYIYYYIAATCCTSLAIECHWRTALYATLWLALIVTQSQGPITEGYTGMAQQFPHHKSSNTWWWPCRPKHIMENLKKNLRYCCI
jgi:hypothetical protein